MVDAANRVSGGKGGAGATVQSVERRISPKAERVLTRLAKGEALVGASGELRLAGEDVDVAITMLVAHDLVRRTSKSYAVTAPGFNYLRRIEAAARWRKLKGQGVDGAGEALAVPFRDQHVEIEPATLTRPGAKAERVWINRAESPLAWLSRRKDKQGQPLISAAQLAAGERFRTDFEWAGLSPRVTVSWSGAPTERGRKRSAYRPLDPTEAQVMARRRYERALDELGGGLADIALRVCCYGEGLEGAERALGWPVRSGKVVLGLALDRLARYYGIG